MSDPESSQQIDTIDRADYLFAVRQLIRECRTEVVAELPERIVGQLAARSAAPAAPHQLPRRRLIQLIDARQHGALDRLPSFEMRLRPMALASLPMVIADRELALVSFSARQPETSAMLIHDADRAAELARTFEYNWAMSSPADDESGLGQSRRLAILAGLADGLTDAAIAASLSVGERTVRREVNALMTRTGSRSRFQLGLRIVNLGLLSRPEAVTLRPTTS